jgi:hypothetical protein
MKEKKNLCHIIIFKNFLSEIKKWISYKIIQTSEGSFSKNKMGSNFF